MRVRLLPATIAVGGLLLVSKTFGLVVASFPGGWAIGEAVVPVAVAASAAETTHPEKPVPAAPSRPPASAASPAANPPPVPVSPEERQLLQDLRSRRQEWDARDRALTERENVLTAAEQRLVARALELASLQTKLEQLEKSRAERDDANWAGLVRVYEAMKPRDAASIFNEMDMPVLLQIADRMKEAKAAAILGAMQPDRARLLTSQLASKRSRTTTLSDAPTTPPAESASHS